MKINIIPFVAAAVLLAGTVSIQCGKPEENVSQAATQNNVESPIKFTLMSPEQTGIKFTNRFKEDYNYNIFNYEYIYNGCGVAVGDLNGDGLPDLYFSSSFGPNRLFLNKGNMSFVDVTKRAGVDAFSGYKTGVTIADVNGDGRLDIYSCRTSKEDDSRKTNLLFINMGNKPTDGVEVPFFEEKANELGLDDNSNSNHASFFDFDRDGDLDLFVLNHRLGFSDAAKIRLQEHTDGSVTRITTPLTPFESNLLYRNDNGKFVNVTAKAGLVSSAFGLSATPVDINKDGWMDIYVANDFIEPDYLYINNRNGTFTDRSATYFRHISQNSMGSDIADINNDGLEDIFVVDMKAEDPFRYKELMTVMQYDRYSLLLQYGYGRQVGRNVLQLNTGNNSFVDIAQYAGVAATDWSWSPLMTDFDNDGWKDMYITNGYRRDITDLDYTNFFRDSIQRTGGLSPKRFPDIYEVLNHIPEKKLNNYLYINSQHLSFVNMAEKAGMNHPSFSNGSAYADLDLDGDMDIIVNNIDDPVFIYRNDITGRSWIQIDFKPTPENKVVLGTKVDVYAGNSYQVHTLMNTKGFLSSSEALIQVGLGVHSQIDSMIITWPGGEKEIMMNVKANQRVIIKKGDGKPYTSSSSLSATPLFARVNGGSNWMHKENEFIDFKTEKLIPYMLSAEGPCLAVGDVNGDGLEDVFAGNGEGFSATLLLNQVSGKFTELPSPALAADASFEDCGAVLDDLDKDGDLDLMVIAGGNAAAVNSPEYMTRYYTNDGKGGFTRTTDFPDIRTNAGAVLSFDYDQDGDKDIIIGGKSTPGRFPTFPRSFLLRNDNGNFSDVTKSVFEELETLGMISDIAAGDLDQDKMPEIVFVGEWMPVTIFSFNGKKFTNKTSSFGLANTSGWWKSVSMEDMDGDGDLDMIAGNIGLNHRLRTSVDEPVTLVTNDFDNNGSLDPVMCYYFQHKLYPYAGRDGIIAQVPRLKKKFLRYKTYASATLNTIFTEEELEASSYLYTHTFETTFFRNEQKKFVVAALPYQTQLHPTFDIIVRDVNQDGRKDILLAGNFLYTEVETAEMDAGNGTLLLQEADGSFRFVPNREHGLWMAGEVRELKAIRLANGKDAIISGNNRGPIEIYEYLK